MLRRAFRRSGDTLVEVTLAVGIFALVAISVVMVVNMSTSGAQSSLENTLAREEIDSQVEALRFIQSAYINDDNTFDKKEDDDVKYEVYKAIWDEIASYAKKNMTEENKQIKVKGSFEYDFHPDTCKSLYDGDPNYLLEQNAFIIDIRKMNEFNGGNVKQFAKEVVLPASAEADNKKIFNEAVSYPHLVYEKADFLTEESGDGLMYEDSYSVLRRAEGIFVVGIQDENTTSIVTGPSTVDNISAYYDFYARGCWYNTGSETPSVVSTKVRLRNPDVAVDVEPEKPEPEPEPELDDTCPDGTPYIQDWYGADMLAIEQTITLRDKRDNQCYIVAKLKDGKVWMLDNLRLGSTDKEIMLTSDDTNIHDSFMLPKSVSGLNYTLVEPKQYADDKNKVGVEVHGVGSGKIGVKYNYCAASGGTVCELYGDSAPSVSINDDICPKGWRMPTGGWGGEYDSLSKAYDTNNGGAANFLNALSVSFGGETDKGFFRELYWSSSIYSSYMAHIMILFSEPEVHSAGATRREHMTNIRCLYKT